ncbi:MAG: hypothetical protein ACFFCS_25420, partial [Candidatus Hodarchaeota archaeon]
CKLVSIENPGVTDSYEFPDGKVMMANFNRVYTMDWELVTKAFGKDSLIQYFAQSELYGHGYWAGAPHGTGIYEGMHEDIFPNLDKSTRHKHLLLDLSDLRKTASSKMIELKKLLCQLEEHVQVLLLLNGGELDALYHSFTGRAIGDRETMDVEEKIQNIIHKLSLIRDTCNISMVAGHTPQYSAIVADKTAHGILNLFYTPKPKFTTGAGDHFTAGIGHGLLVHMPTKLLPLLGSMTASYFVSNGTIPAIKDVVDQRVMVA